MRFRTLFAPVFAALLVSLPAAYSQDTAPPPRKSGGSSKSGDLKKYDDVITKDATTLPGVFAVHRLDEKVYFGTLLATTAASLCLIATSVRHRLRFRHGDKEWVVLSGNRLAIMGLGFLGLAISGAILLVSDVLFGTATAAVATTTVAAMLVWLWFGSPLLRQLRSDE